MDDKTDVMFHVVAPMTQEHETEIRNQIHLLGMGNNVKLYGRISNQEVHSLMKASDVFLFTSLSEGTPHVILEAIKNNLPIVCFDICGHGEVVDESIGIKIPLSTIDKSSKQFAEELTKLRKNKVLRDTLSRNCEAKQQECSWDNKTSQIFHTYMSICKHQ